MEELCVEGEVTTRLEVNIEKLKRVVDSDLGVYLLS